MLKKILIAFFVVAALFVMVGLLVPADYSIERKITIQAPPEAVHAWVGELKRWPEWAPWHEQDPSIVTTYGAATTGVGAHQTWTAEDGDGELTFTQCDPASGIAYEMAFIQGETRVPATCAMTYARVGDATEVSWSMQGSWKGAMPPVLDGWMKLATPWMLGGMFDQGLETLKAKVEAAG